MLSFLKELMASLLPRRTDLPFFNWTLLVDSRSSQLQFLQFRWTAPSSR